MTSPATSTAAMAKPSGMRTWARPHHEQAEGEDDVGAHRDDVQAGEQPQASGADEEQRHGDRAGTGSRSRHRASGRRRRRGGAGPPGRGRGRELARWSDSLTRRWLARGRGWFTRKRSVAVTYGAGMLRN